MPEPLRETVCLDTSAVNAIKDAANSERLLDCMLQRYTPRITALNIAEVVQTPDGEERADLLRVLAKLGGVFRPLLMPNDLLRVATKSFATGKNVAITIGAEDEMLWRVLQRPEIATDRERVQAEAWIKSADRGFKAAHKSARPMLQAHLETRRIPQFPTTAKMLKFFYSNDEAIFDFTRKVYRRWTRKPLNRSLMWRMFEFLPDWPLCLAVWGHQMFERAIRQHNYGARGKPGAIDLFFAAYLPYCQYFVTNDRGLGRGGQYRALRLLVRLVPPMPNRPRPRVLTFAQFVRTLRPASSTYPTVLQRG